ncbi:MAG: pyochelin biosynthetic protein PchC [Octadecabacter sp.]|jgi:pyochelin biosynthetic protein PchC
MDVICLPHAGGGAGLFSGWQAPAGMRLHPVCLPGRELRIREPLFHTLDPVLDWLEEELADILDCAHIILGHSMGAVVGHALCQRRLSVGKRLPRALVVSACLPPVLRVRRDLHLLDDTALLVKLIGFDPENVALAEHPELWEMMAPVIRADFAVIDDANISPDQQLPIPIMALCGRADPMVTPTQMTEWVDIGDGFTQHSFDGGHFYLRNASVRILQAMSLI